MLFRNKNPFSFLEAEFYSTMDPRRRQEYSDSKMVSEDHRAMSNLPMQGFQRQFDTQKFMRSPWRDDEVRG